MNLFQQAPQRNAEGKLPTTDKEMEAAIFEFDQKYSRWLANERTKHPYWETADDRKIPWHIMATDHLQNIIRKFRRDGTVTFREAWFQMYMRGDAWYTSEMHKTYVGSLITDPRFEILCHENYLRGISGIVISKEESEHLLLEFHRQRAAAHRNNVRSWVQRQRRGHQEVPDPRDYMDPNDFYGFGDTPPFG